MTDEPTQNDAGRPPDTPGFEDLRRRLDSTDPAERRRGFDLLVRRYQPDLERYVHAQFFQVLRPTADSLDIVMEVFERAVEKIDAGKIDYGDEERLVALLKRMARNQMISKTRRGRLPRAPMPLGAGDTANPAVDPEGSGPTPSRAAMEAERLAAALRAGSLMLDRLDADERALFTAWLLDGADYATLAARRGKSAEAVRLELFRIRKNLAKAFPQFRELVDPTF